MALVAFEQIVIELCKETGEPGFLNSQTVTGCLLDGIRDLSLHAMPSYNIIEGLTVNDYNAICWPTECVKPLITFVTRDGKSLALDVNDDLLGGIVNSTTNCTCFQDAEREINDFFRIDGIGYGGYYNAWNWGLGEVYGYGTGYRSLGIVTHDPTRRQSFVKGITLLSTDTYGFFAKTDGLSQAPMFVPAEAKEALEYFALAKYYRTRNPNLGELNKKNYKEEFRRLQCWLNDDGEAAWSIAVNSNNRSSPKGIQ